MTRWSKPVTFECEWCGMKWYMSQPSRLRKHCNRSCSSKHTASRRSFAGPNNPRFNGGLCIHQGRTMICCRDGSVLWYSRALVEAELKRPLRSDEIVHHVNGDGSDDRVENLQVVTRAEHINLHREDLLDAKRRKKEAQIA